MCGRWCAVSVSVIMAEHGQRKQGSAGGGGRFDYAYFSDQVLRDYAAKAVHQASVNLAAKPAPAGAMTVVLGSGSARHPAARGHRPWPEGDFNRKGSSAFAGPVGQRVAAKA